MNSKNLLCLGRVVKAHGFKGDILVRLYNENIKFTNDLKEIWLGEDSNHVSSWQIENIYGSDERVFLKLRYVDSLEEANFLKSLDAFIDKEMVTEKSMYDTIGFLILDNNSEEEIGVVNDITQGAMQSLLVFETGNEEKFIPIVDEFIKYIDWEKEKIFVDLIDGLI